MPVASRLVQMPSSSRSPGIGGMIGSAPLASDDVIGRVAHAVDLDGAGPGQPAGAAQQVDAVVGKPALLSGIGVLGDHEVAPGQRGLHVHLGARRRLARAVHRLARSQQRLRRDARPVGALAANQLALHHRHPQPALGERAGAVLARGARAQHDDVVVVAHVTSVGRSLQVSVEPGGARRAR